jgi:hypothetical protein
MAVTPVNNNYTVGRGETHLARFAPGTQNPLGFRYIGNNPAFGFTVTTQDLDHYGMDHGVGEMDFTVPVQTNRAGTFSTDNVSNDNLAMTFLGTSLIASATAATGLTETLPDVIAGLTYQLGMATATPYGRRSLANLVVKVGGTTKMPGTDYVADLKRGEIYIVPASAGGTIVSGTDDLAVTYDQLASSVAQVISGSTPFEGAVKFVADNTWGTNNDFFMPWVRITPNGEFALKAENALQVLSFNMKILKKPGAAAFYINGQPYSA